MKKLTLIALVAVSVMSCNAFKKSDWKLLEEDIKFSQVLKYTAIEIYDDIDEGVFSTGYLGGKYDDYTDASIKDQSALTKFLFLGYICDNDNWESVFDQLVVFLNKYSHDTMDKIPDDVANAEEFNDVGKRTIANILTASFLEKFKENDPSCTLTYPEFYVKANNTKYYRFYDSLWDTTYSLYMQTGFWRWEAMD